MANPKCKKCGAPMRLFGEEKQRGLVEVRSYSCEPCGETIAVPIANITKQI